MRVGQGVKAAHFPDHQPAGISDRWQRLVEALGLALGAAVQRVSLLPINGIGSNQVNPT